MKSADDPMFWSIKDSTALWRSFTDDVLNLFRENEKQAEWYFGKLNSLYPGQVNFNWEFSKEGGIFLNIEIIKN